MALPRRLAGSIAESRLHDGTVHGYYYSLLRLAQYVVKVVMEGCGTPSLPDCAGEAGLSRGGRGLAELKVVAIRLRRAFAHREPDAELDLFWAGVLEI